MRLILEFTDKEAADVNGASVKTLPSKRTVIEPVTVT
jgi:hypothetical protein